MTAVRDARPGDEAEWRRLWSGYLAFYRTTLPDHVTTHTWRRALDPASTLLARVAASRGGLAGFAMCVLHEGTWVAAPICYLEDLFVDPDARGAGIGRALLDDLVALGAARGWSRLHWNAGTGNPARRLYDRLAAVQDTVHYQMTLPGPAADR